MIELLSNESWLRPQIDFLLFLQNLRISHFSMFDNLFLSVTIVGEFWLPVLICSIVYWCIDFKSGMYLFALSSFNMFFAQLFKMMACVYRPWVLSDKIHPVEKAIALAAGYSFPSGHSAQASALLGGLAMIYKKKFIIPILLVLFALLVGFSRMWLGVHTPQDVIVGLFIGFSLVFMLNSVINKAEKNTNIYLYLLGITDFAIAAILVYICYFNSYPLDYVNGELLVNPLRSIQASVFCYSFIAGILNGVFLCRRFFPFNPKEFSLKSKLAISFIGTLCILSTFPTIIKNLFCQACDFKIVFILAFIIGFFVTGIYPLIFSKFVKLK